MLLKETMTIWRNYLLAEGRVDDAIGKYPDIEEEIRYMADNDPSGNNKYLGWMAKQVSNGADHKRVTKLVKQFHDNKQRLDKKDIYQYSVDELDNTVSALGRSRSEKSQDIREEQTKTLYEDEDVLILIPLTSAASCHYGSGTKWCISADSQNMFTNYVTNPRSKSVFAFIIRKDLDREDPYSKVSFQIDWRSGEILYVLWSADDKIITKHSSPYPDPPEEFFDKMGEIIGIDGVGEELADYMYENFNEINNKIIDTSDKVAYENGQRLHEYCERNKRIADDFVFKRDATEMAFYLNSDSYHQIVNSKYRNIKDPSEIDVTLGELLSEGIARKNGVITAIAKELKEKDDNWPQSRNKIDKIFNKMLDRKISELPFERERLKIILHTPIVISEKIIKNADPLDLDSWQAYDMEKMFRKAIMISEPAELFSVRFAKDSGAMFAPVAFERLMSSLQANLEQYSVGLIDVFRKYSDKLYKTLDTLYED